MAYADTLYSARLGFEIFVQGRANVIKCPVYRDGALAAPSSGTVTIYDRSGTVVVSAATVTVSSSIAQRTVTSATLADYAYGDGWRVEWSLVMPDGVTHAFLTEGALARRPLYPVITDLDLFARYPGLSPSATQRLATYANFQDRIDEAWRMLIQRLSTDGNIPWWIADPVSLRATHLALTLALVFRDLAVFHGSADSLFAAESTELRAEYEREYRSAHSRILRDDAATQTKRRQSPSPTVWTCKGGAWPI